MTRSVSGSAKAAVNNNAKPNWQHEQGMDHHHHQNHQRHATNPPANPPSSRRAAAGSVRVSKCWLCTFSNSKMAKRIAEFVSLNAGIMDPAIMADQIKQEVRKEVIRVFLNVP